MESENQQHDIGLSVAQKITIAKISGKCGIQSGEIVSPVEIVCDARYGTPLNEILTALT